MSQVILTGVEDTARRILLLLDDEDLFRACSTSHDTLTLCNGQFWFQKFFNTYQTHLNQYGFSIDNDDYKKLYKKLRKLSNEEIFLYAVENGYVTLVESILSSGKFYRYVGEKALRLAAEKGRLAVVELLLEHGAAINSDVVDQALRLAAEKGQLAVVELLLDRGADINSDDGDEAFRLAAQQGHLAVVELLLERGADVDGVPSDSYNALILAAEEGHLAMVELLLAHGANVHVRKDTALTLAAGNGHLDVVELLLDAGAAIIDDDGDNPFGWAAKNGHSAVMKVLLDHGKYPQIYVDRALAEASQKDVVELLLDYGADLHVDNDYALISAAGEGHLAIIKLLLYHGADLHANNDEALRWAATNGKLAVVELLLDRGAKIDLIKGVERLSPEIKLFLEQYQKTKVNRK